MNKLFPSDPPAVQAGYQHTPKERSPLLDEQFVDEAYGFSLCYTFGHPHLEALSSSSSSLSDLPVCRHIEAFAAALAAPDLSSIDSNSTTPATHNSPAAANSPLPSSSSKPHPESSSSHVGGGDQGGGGGVERVTALSDFAPVNLRVKYVIPRSSPLLRQHDLIHT
jgi:hypothetical protein